MSSSDVSFTASDGVVLRGNLISPVAPDTTDEKLPCVILVHGFTCVKEMGLVSIATYLSTHLPLRCLVYDHRGFGSSDTLPGYPRCETIPSQQVLDLRDAITFATSLPSVDASRIGLWGYSYSGGQALQLGAADRRVKAVIVHSPCIDGWEVVHRVMTSHSISTARPLFEADRLNRMKGERPMTIPVVTFDPAQSPAFASPEATAFFSAWDPMVKEGSSWRNEITLRSLEELIGYVTPLASLRYITPTPVLMSVGLRDTNLGSDMALRHYSKLREPKELCIVDAHHFEFITEGKARHELQEKEVAFLRRTLCS